MASLTHKLSGIGHSNIAYHFYTAGLFTAGLFTAGLFTAGLFTVEVSFTVLFFNHGQFSAQSLFTVIFTMVNSTLQSFYCLTMVKKTVKSLFTSKKKTIALK